MNRPVAVRLTQWYPAGTRFRRSQFGAFLVPIDPRLPPGPYDYCAIQAPQMGPFVAVSCGGSPYRGEDWRTAHVEAQAGQMNAKRRGGVVHRRRTSPHIMTENSPR